MAKDVMPNQFIGTRKTGGRFYYQFQFVCSCGYFAELGVPQHNKKLIDCPECGALFFMIRPSGMFASPRLLSVTNSNPASA